MILMITRFIHFCSLHSEAVPGTLSFLEELFIRLDADFDIAAWLFWMPGIVWLVTIEKYMINSLQLMGRSETKKYSHLHGCALAVESSSFILFFPGKRSDPGATQGHHQCGP